MGDPSSDEELIEGYLLGDRKALRILDDWIIPVVRHRSWSLREREEDLLQEIRLKLLKLFEARAFRGESSLKTYVRSAAKYTCLDAVRRARIRQTEELREELSPLSRDHPAHKLQIPRGHGLPQAFPQDSLNTSPLPGKPPAT